MDVSLKHVFGHDPMTQLMNKLTTTVTYIVTRSAELRNTYTNAVTAPIEFACIFCRSEEDYLEFTREIETLGRIVETTTSGYTYLLDKPIVTAAGPLRLVKIRKPDSLRSERGDADFNTDYKNFKKLYEGDPKFEFIKREKFEMLRLSDPSFEVMACFSSIPKSKVLGIRLLR